MLDTLPWSTLSDERPSAFSSYGNPLDAVTATPGFGRDEFDPPRLWLPRMLLRWAPLPDRPEAIQNNFCYSNSPSFFFAPAKFAIANSKHILFKLPGR